MHHVPSPSTRVRRLAAASLLTASLLLAACRPGDGDGATGSPSPSPSPSPLTKEAYVQQANDLCRTGAVPPGEPPKTGADVVTGLERLAAGLEQLANRLGALVPPPEDRDAIRTQWLGPRQDQVRVLREAIPAARNAAQGGGDAVAVSQVVAPALNEVARLAGQAAEFARPYGLTDCI